MKTIKIALVAVVMLSSMMTALAQSECKVNYQLFKDAYRNKDYDQAYVMMKDCIANCPNVGENLYINGVALMKIRMNAATDPAVKATYIDSICQLYDLRVQYYGKPEKNLANKAADIEKLVGEKGVDKYYPLYAAAIEKAGAKMEAKYVYLYFNAAVDYVKAGFAEPTLIIDCYDIASTLLDDELTESVEKYNASKEEGDAAKMAKDSILVASIRAQIASVEGTFSPYASCDQLVAIYSKKFEADPNNLDLLKKITKIMSAKGCTKEDLFFQATKNLYALEPTPKTAYMMGAMCLGDEKYSEAVRYLKDATEGLTDKKDLYRAYIYLGRAHAGANSYSAARSAYYKAAELDGTKGEPYLMIASLYASSSRSINDGLNGRSAYWAAVDKAIRAKNVDNSPENVEAANRMIGSYSGYYPKKQDAFMLDLIDGHSYVVPGWIGESTTIRTR